MNGFLLDTNSLSALRRPAENQALIEFLRVQPSYFLHTSTLNFAEIRRGIELKQDAVQRADLVLWLENVVRPLFEERVHDISEDVLLRWLFIIAEGRSRGHTHSNQDSLIAAVAVVHQLVVITCDETHFVRAGVPTLDPWRSTYYDYEGQAHAIANLVSATLINELP